MGTNYQRGAARERKAQDYLEGQGWVVARSAGSRSPMDLVACRAGHTVRFVQVKADAAGPYAHFGPEERRMLKDAATQAGAAAELWWWPPRQKGPRILGPDDWPT